MFTEEQMVRNLRESDKAPVAEVAKKHGIRGETAYTWPRKLSSLNVGDSKKLEALELENGKLGTLLNARLLDIEVLRDISSRRR